MIYGYICNKCEHKFDKHLPMCEMKVPLNKPCPECGTVGEVERHITNIRIGDINRIYPHRALGDFKEVLSNIHQKTYKSTLNQKF